MIVFYFRQGCSSCTLCSYSWWRYLDCLVAPSCAFQLPHFKMLVISVFQKAGHQHVPFCTLQTLEKSKCHTHVLACHSCMVFVVLHACLSCAIAIVIRKSSTLKRHFIDDSTLLLMFTNKSTLLTALSRRIDCYSIYLPFQSRHSIDGSLPPRIFLGQPPSQLLCSILINSFSYVEMHRLLLCLNVFMSTHWVKQWVSVPAVQHHSAWIRGGIPIPFQRIGRASLVVTVLDSDATAGHKVSTLSLFFMPGVMQRII